MHGFCLIKRSSMINNNFYTTNPKIWKGINKETFMKLKFIWAAIASFVLSLCNIANAGIISYHTASSVQGSACQSMGTEFINDNKDVIEDIYSDSSFSSSCAYYSEVNGTNTEVNNKSIGGRNSYSGIPLSVFTESVLDEQALSLPEIHMYADSRSETFSGFNSVIGRTFAAQQYYWGGESTTLTFTADFDYSISADGSTSGAFYEAAIAAITDLTVSTNSMDVYPIDIDESLLLGGRYYSSNLSSQKGQERYEVGTISFDFDVIKGTDFYLFGRGTVKAWNGGWVDSSHTLTSLLTVKGLDSNESEAIISNNIRRINTISVPEPSTLAIFALGIMGLASRRFKKQ